MRTATFSEAELEALRNSFARLIPYSDDVAATMYLRLFADHPHIEALFHSEPDLQRDKLIQTLAIMIDSASNPERFASTGSKLGRQHDTYGVEPEMYAVLKGYLVGALQDEVRPPLTDEEVSLWSRLYDAISESMMGFSSDKPA